MPPARGRRPRLFGEALLALPHVRSGPLARQWAVRARTFDAFMARLIRPMAAARGRPLQVLDLGAAMDG